MSSKIEDRPRFVASLRQHERFDALATLARRALDPLADARAGGASREFVAGLADELGITHETAVEGIRLRSTLERGAESAEEWALVSALALTRWSSDLEAVDASVRGRKFVRLADAMEGRGVDFYGWVEPSMSEVAAQCVVTAMVAASIEDAAQGRAGRSRAYARVEALRAMGSDSARHALIEGLGDSPLAAVLGRTPDTRTSFSYRASTTPPPRTGFVGALRLLSGLAIVEWIGRGLGSLVGLTTVADVAVDPGGIAIETRTAIGGRVLRHRTERFARAALVGAAQVTQYPALHLLVGALALALGIVVGGTLIVDGVRSGETALLLVGAALVGGGAALDLVLSVILPSARGKAVLQIALAPSRILCLSGVEEADAAATLDAVHAPRRRD